MPPKKKPEKQYFASRFSGLRVYIPKHGRHVQFEFGRYFAEDPEEIKVLNATKGVTNITKQIKDQEEKTLAEAERIKAKREAEEAEKGGGGEPTTSSGAKTTSSGGKE